MAVGQVLARARNRVQRFMEESTVPPYRCRYCSDVLPTRHRYHRHLWYEHSIREE